MTRRLLLLLSLCFPVAALAETPDRVSYRSPYTVNFHFKEADLIGDLLNGPRSDWKEQAAVPFREWYLPGHQSRWGTWGPPAKHYDPPAGFSSKSVTWLRERIIAAGMQFVGLSYQHHHVPHWEPPADWPRDPDAKTPAGKGLDCSNFTSFVYNIALGIKPTSDVQDQAAIQEAPGPGKGRHCPVKRVELPQTYADYEKELLTGDLLFVKNTRGQLAHVVIWVGKIGQSPDGTPLILDSTGTGSRDASGQDIPDGIYLRPFKPTSWYFTQASHVLRLIPDGQ